MLLAEVIDCAYHTGIIVQLGGADLQSFRKSGHHRGTHFPCDGVYQQLLLCADAAADEHLEALQHALLDADMYNPYISYVEKYFPNAVSVVDSFHVIQWITRMIDNYIRQLLKRFRQRDREYQEKLSLEQQVPISLPPSDEVYLLQKYRWLILCNQSNIRYHTDPRMDPHFHALMNTYDYEDALFRIDYKLKEFRDLKELYLQFNARNGGNPSQAQIELEELIETYRKSRHEIFREFASLLEKYKASIINSFIMVEKIGNGRIYDSRLSNGPIESINRKIKDLKRLGRGFRNFEHFRNRFLYATRSVPVLNGITDYNPVLYLEEEDF